MATPIEKKYADTGMPDLSESEKKPVSKAWFQMVVNAVIMWAVGVFFAWVLLNFGASAASKKIYDKNMAGIAAAQQHWVYLGAVVVTRTVAWVNFAPMIV